MSRKEIYTCDACGQESTETMAKYQIADMDVGPFGDTFDTLEAAEQELATCIEEGAAIGLAEGELTPEQALADAQMFFEIVNAGGVVRYSGKHA